MIISARTAGRATRFAPTQSRKATAAAEIRGLFGPSLVMWLDPQGDTHSVGSSIDSTNDRSGRANVFAQGTVAKRPTKVVRNNGVAFQFIGASNNTLATNSLNWSAYQTLTVVSLHELTNTTEGVVIERGADYNLSLAGFICSGKSTLFSTGIRGNGATSGGYSVRTWSAAQTPTASAIVGFDKTAALGNEITAFQDGVAVSAFSISLDTDNTNDYGTAVNYIGSRAGTTAPISGYISQLILLSRVLTASEAARLNTLIRQRSGV
jgi:hypothetical protein